MNIKTDKFGHELVKIKCPLNEVGCGAKKARFIDAYSIKKTEGRCRSCDRVRKVRQKIESALGVKVNLRFTPLGKARRLQIYISCPVKSLCCNAKKARWVWIEYWRGLCSPCVRFKGGWLDKWGYRRFRIGNKAVAEHRFIMEKMLGRKLRKGETVHHKNGKRADNRKQNLELRMSGRHPQGWSLRQMRKYLKTVPKRLGGLK
jgi:hypothetical protein